MLQPTIDSVRARASSRARFACAWLEAAPTPRACAPPVAGRHSPARDLLQLRPLRARPLSAPADAARVATDDR
ncbi:hypothetical protein DIJ63_34715 [Burkholderia pseudomallei]|nr:hypothetical protein DIJ63_34715 [Burkholderia pseudomallei]